MFGFGAREIAAESRHLAARFEVALDLVPQRFDQAWHGDQHGYTLAVNCANYFARIERVQKDGRSAEKLRNENSEKLSEHMAQRQELEEAQRMKNAFVAAIARELFFDGSKVREDVSVR